jgi:hypothetical protein
MLLRSCFWLVSALLPWCAAAEVVCALGPSAASYNASADQRPSPDAMKLVSRVNAALAPACLPNCPAIAVFRNATAPKAMLILANGDARIVYEPQFFSMLYDKYGDGAIIAIIAHEFGHALAETVPAAWMKANWTAELRADAWAGCALAKSGLSAPGVKDALTALSKYPPPAQPGWPLRLPAVRLGFTHCGGEASQFDGESGH